MMIAQSLHLASNVIRDTGTLNYRGKGLYLLTPISRVMVFGPYATDIKSKVQLTSKNIFLRRRYVGTQS